LDSSTHAPSRWAKDVALESTRTIEIDEFVDKAEIDPRYLIRPYYLRPDGKVGHDAFAVIRETLREMNKVAIGRVVLTNREHIIALEAMEKGLVGTLLRYPYEVRSEAEYFDEIQDVKVTKGMLDLAKHIVNQKSGSFEPEKFEDHYVDCIGRPHQSEARREADHAEGAAARRKRCRPDGGAAPECRRRPVQYLGSEEAGQEAAQRVCRSEGDADADRWQEAGKGDGDEEARSQAASEVRLMPRRRAAWI
jgi:DNA end-binding protein Ku